MEDITLSGFGDILKAYRKQRKISQQALASLLDVHRNTIGGWERGDFLPESKTIVLELAKQLHLNEIETRRLLEASLTAITPYWNVPYQRNPFFTGRDELLHTLHEQLRTKQAVALCQSYALSGLGGIGKTQLALEYAYQYALDYRAIFWVAAETVDTLFSSFITIAELIKLPEREEKDYQKIVKAVLRWFTAHDEWLLIFDNVEDTSILKPFLPASRQGAILITTRLRALDGFALAFELLPFPIEEGLRFLLHRSRLLGPMQPVEDLSSDQMKIAQTLVEIMGGLPLALDQAGAYIEATQCSLSDYLLLFQSSQLRLLDERNTHIDHPLSVTKTFSLSFAQLERSNPIATEFLTVCAYLAPEGIPEAFFNEGAKHLGPMFETLAADPFQFHATLKALLSYSLLQRNASNKTMTLHRLVQVVLKGRQPETVQRIWKVRVMYTMSQIFPSSMQELQSDYWQICEQLLSHALVCMTWSEQWGENVAAFIALMSHIASYLLKRARYTEAGPLFQQALHMGERELDPEHFLVAEVLQGQANLYREQGKYEEAEPLYHRALYIREQALEPEYILIVSILNGLALLYWEQGRYEEAEHLYKRTLHIQEQTLEPENPLLARVLYNLAILYHEQGKYEEAKELLKRTLSIFEHALGLECAEIGYPLTGLGTVYSEQGKHEEAEALYKRAVRVREQALGPKHPLVAYPLNNLAILYCEQGKGEEAEYLYERVLRIREEALGLEHPEVAAPLQGLADLYREQGKYEEAKMLLQRALHIREETLGSEHPKIADTLTMFANLYRDQGKYEEAEALYRRAIVLLQQGLGLHHPHLAETLHYFARFCQIQQRTVEALSLYQQALMIREQTFGLTHPKTSETRNQYAQLLRHIFQHDEAIEHIEAQHDDQPDTTLTK